MRRYKEKKEEKKIENNIKKYLDYNLYNETKEKFLNNQKNLVIKTRSRSSTIYPFFIDSTFKVYTGKRYLPLKITKNLFGRKLGEFIFTRTFKKHKKATKPSSIKKKSKLSIYSKYFDNCNYLSYMLETKINFI